MNHVCHSNFCKHNENNNCKLKEIKQADECCLCIFTEISEDILKNLEKQTSLP